MSADWISMEKSLWSHPKVVRIMSACKADKCPVIGALYRLWSIADTHTDDGFLNGYSPEAIDKEVEIQGFAQATAAVGWLIISESGLQIPDFQEHMSKSAKRRLLDAKRKKSVRKKSAKSPQPSGQKADHITLHNISIPDGIDNDSWARYFEYRQAMPKQKRLTGEACKLAFDLLAQYPLATQKQIIETSIMNGWTGLFPPKGGPNGQTHHAPKLTAHEQRLEKLNEWERKHGGTVIDGQALEIPN